MLVLLGDGEASYFDTPDIILGNLSSENSVEVVFEYADGMFLLHR